MDATVFPGSFLSGVFLEGVIVWVASTRLHLGFTLAQWLITIRLHIFIDWHDCFRFCIFSVSMYSLHLNTYCLTSWFNNSDLKPLGFWGMLGVAYWSCNYLLFLQLGDCPVPMRVNKEYQFYSEFLFCASRSAISTQVLCPFPSKSHWVCGLPGLNTNTFLQFQFL